MVFEMASSQPLYVRAVSKYVQRSLQKSVLKGRVPKGIDVKVAAKRDDVCKGHDEAKVTGMELSGAVYERVDTSCASNANDAVVNTAHAHSHAHADDGGEEHVISVSGTVSEECSIAPTNTPTATPKPTAAATAPSLSAVQSSLSSSTSISTSISPSISVSLSRSLSDDNDNENDSGQAVGDRDLLILQSSQGSATDQTLREKELLEDFDVAYKEYRDNSGVPLMCAGRGGPVYCSSDFVTASVEMNRSLFNGQLAGEEKRRILFGSDQIVP